MEKGFEERLICKGSFLISKLLLEGTEGRKGGSIHHACDGKGKAETA